MVYIVIGRFFDSCSEILGGFLDKEQAIAHAREEVDSNEYSSVIVEAWLGTSCQKEEYYWERQYNEIRR